MGAEHTQPELSFFGLEYALRRNMPVLPNAVLTNLMSKGVEVKVFKTYSRAHSKWDKTRVLRMERA